MFDPARPVAVLLSGVAEWVPDGPCGSPHEAVKALVEALGPGSWLAVTHVTADYAPQALAAAQEAYRQWGLAFRPRTWREVEALFSGLHLLSPGVEVWGRWRPGPGRRLHPCVTGYAGVGRLGDLPPAATRAPRWVPVT